MTTACSFCPAVVAHSKCVKLVFTHRQACASIAVALQSTSTLASTLHGQVISAHQPSMPSHSAEGFWIVAQAWAGLLFGARSGMTMTGEDAKL